MDFIDLKAQQRRIRAGIDERIKKVLDHGRYIMGPEVQELEDALCEFSGAKHCISCASGTDALMLILLAEGIGAGDVVFVPNFTFIATAEVVSLLGATPVFVDVDPEDFNISLSSLKKVIEVTKVSLPTHTLRGIIAVDLFGQPADYTEINDIAADHKMFVLADAAQSFGAYYESSRVGTLGDYTATSFFPAKPLGCYGDGGAVFCKSEESAEALRSLRIHGKSTMRYKHSRVGLNARMDSIQAAILLEKLSIFEEEISLRQEVAARYQQLLGGSVETPKVKSSRTSVWAQYCVTSSSREELQSRLKEHKIPSVVYYPIPLAQQDCFSELPFASERFAVSEHLANSIFALPMHPYLKVDEQEQIAAALSKGI